MRTKQFNEEVLYAEGSIVKVGRSDIDQLKEQAVMTERKRIRLCTHKDVDAKIHEMLIVHAKGAYVRPHKHLNKIESFHVIEGLLDVVVFDDIGRITEVIKMGDYPSQLKFYHRISEPLFHTVLVRSDIVVFHEITNGPFVRSDTIFPEWSPEEKDSAACLNYMNGLKNVIEKKLGRVNE